MRSAVAPRWRGAPGRLEVWYATLSDPVTRAGLWVHCETVAPTNGGAPYAHGWVTWFPADGHRAPNGSAPSPSARGRHLLVDAAGVRAGAEGLTGRRGRWHGTVPGRTPARRCGRFPRDVGARIAARAQVVLAPTGDFSAP